MEFGDFCVFCIKANAVIWIVFFVSWLIKALIKNETIEFSLGDAFMWLMLSVLSSLLGAVTFSIFCFILLVWLLATLWELFDKYWLDGIVEFLSKRITIKK